MRINKIHIHNFRQYYGDVVIDFSTTAGKNIVIIGGKNGYGKTNLLLSLVWCLYGNKITQIDDNFGREIKKESNYQRYMKQSLCRQALNEGKNSFYVELFVDDIENSNASIPNSVIVRREYNITSCDECLQVLSINRDAIASSDEEMVHLINDYIIPLEAAKFVFFDAEKIASWAELSTKEEGNVLNDALGQLLGLDIYDRLKDDIQVYIDGLRRDNADFQIKDQIKNREQEISIKENRINLIISEIAELEDGINEEKRKIHDYNTYLSNNTSKDAQYDREDISNKLEILYQKKELCYQKFVEMVDIIPLAILGGRLSEVVDHIQMQDKQSYISSEKDEIRDKIETFIEELFNRPPEPDQPISFNAKMFYTNKANVIMEKIFNTNDREDDLKYVLDLRNADKELIGCAQTLIAQQSTEQFNTMFGKYAEVQNSISEYERILRIIDSEYQDDIICEYATMKSTSERSVNNMLRKQGGLSEQRKKIEDEIYRAKQSLGILLQKSLCNETITEKIEVAKRYVTVLKTYVERQKKSKKQSLASNLLQELRTLMHKMHSDNSRLIDDVKIDILPDDKGLKVMLLQSDGRELPKESLSTGEKQVYISCLIKVILKESQQGFPIFIDTPLGRLDHDHIESILQSYYPNLSEQVVLLSTNNEITSRRYNTIKDIVSKSYIIDNNGGISNVKLGYFEQQ